MCLGKALTARLHFFTPFLLLGYFLFFSWDRINTRFAEDDMMNMGFYFQHGPARALASQFLLWKTFYRPMGAAFYLPLHHWFGLNPKPFQIAILVLLAFNLLLAYALARALGCPKLVCALAVFVLAYHAGLGNLEYNVDMVYDVLCFSFFIGALVYYIRIRRRGTPLRWRQSLIFLLLYIGALDSKEMALTFPFILAAYEWIYEEELVERTSPARDPLPLRSRLLTFRLRGPRLLLVFTFLLCLLDLYGKRFGSGAMMSNSAYRPVFSLAQFMGFQKAALRDLFANFVVPGWRGVLVIWAIITWLAWRRKRLVLRFCWAYMLLTPLPIAFLNRTQGALYIPLAGWAIFAAVIFVDLAEALAPSLSREPLFRHLGRTAAVAILIAAGLWLWAARMLELKRAYIQPAAAAQGIQTANVIQQLRALQPRVRPHSRIVFLNDPFYDWDMSFIAMLWFADRSIEVYNQRKQHLSAVELAAMDHVFDFRNGKLVQLR